MQPFTRALTCGGLFLVVIPLGGGCGSRTGLPSAMGASTGGAGTVGTNSTGGAGMTSSGAAGAASANADGGGGVGDAGSDTLPEGWTGAQALQVQQSFCSSFGSPPTSFELIAAGEGLEGTLRCFDYRDFNFPSLCAFASDSGATTRVLVQPCDLHPTNVPKGEALYDVRFTLPARAARTTVEMYERGDYYGAKTPPVPTLLATVAVPAGNDGGSARDGSDD